jgi:hypothetical protein
MTNKFGWGYDSIYNGCSVDNHKQYLYSLNDKNITEKECDNMIKGNYEVAMVKFLQGMNTAQEYAFALYDDDMLIDDLVLCDTVNGYRVAKISKIMPQREYNGVPVTKEIICKVDFTNFETRKKNRVKAEQLRTEMDKKLKDLQEIALYELMAEKSPELKEMLETYKSLI